jgi:hypothetical protein
LVQEASSEVHQWIWWAWKDVPDIVHARTDTEKAYRIFDALNLGPWWVVEKYIMRFNQEKLIVESPSEESIFVALYRVIRANRPLMVELARRPLNSLQEFMDKAEEFIIQEETLWAILCSNPSWVSTPEIPKKKKKVHREENPANFKPSKSFREYNFTPFNAPITEVLMEVKKDPEYVKPPKIFGKPPTRTNDWYCAFHEANGHITEGCIALRVLIEKIIENGKLVQLLTKQRNQHNPALTHQPREDRDRDHIP